jgi:hydrogenase maturation protein HypF
MPTDEPAARDSRARRDRYRIELDSAAQGAAFSRKHHVAPLTVASFLIAGSETSAQVRSSMQNDLATCTECLREVMDPANRRHGYAFTKCTACGPRFSITEGLPYNRALTTMRPFEMCDDCRREYETPTDRRYRAQSNACPRCGPQLSRSISEIAHALRAGSIVALKGLGGFHLLCDARDTGTVARLRQRKARDYRPFAVMMPSLAVASAYCVIDEREAALLTSSASPIVLLRARQPSAIAPEVSGRAPSLAALLPYSALYHLLMHEYGAPVVATSGDLSGEPIAVDNDEAQERLGSIADLIVTHDRAIVRPCDDSVVRVGASGPTMLRRARGYAALPIDVGVELPHALAVGAHLKNTIAIGIGQRAMISQHIGDLDTASARRVFEVAIDDMSRTYGFTPEFVVADRHPDYASRRWAEASGFKVVEVQHHHAHVAACAAENGVTGRYLGIAWDGAGLGDDGAVWGGEFFAVDGQRCDRVAHLRPFRLLGGDAAAREGWRVVLSMDWASYGATALGRRDDNRTLKPMLTRGVNAPWSTSVGRLFDAVAAVAGICERNRFEGESALALEASINPRSEGTYPFGTGVSGDWEPLLAAIRRDLNRAVSPAAIAARFHRTLVDWVCRVAQQLQIEQIVLSGGVFQNAFLLDRSIAALTARGHRVYAHRHVPANDGGLSLGQLFMARHA